MHGQYRQGFASETWPTAWVGKADLQIPFWVLIHPLSSLTQVVKHLFPNSISLPLLISQRIKFRNVKSFKCPFKRAVLGTEMKGSRCPFSLSCLTPGELTRFIQIRSPRQGGARELTRLLGFCPVKIQTGSGPLSSSPEVCWGNFFGGMWTTGFVSMASS